MNQKELWNKFNGEWKQQHPSRYVAWLIFYICSFIPLLIGVIPCLMGNINDSTVTKMIICFFIFLAMEIVALVLNMDRKKAWKAYLSEHKQ